MKAWCSLHGYYIFPEKLRTKCNPKNGKPCQHLRKKFQSRFDRKWKDEIEPTPFDQR